MIATIPRTKARFATLEPTMFPRAKSGNPYNADWTLTTNSGAEVAKETIVKPTMNLGICNFIEADNEPLKRNSPPLMRKNKPKIIAKNSI